MTTTPPNLNPSPAPTPAPAPKKSGIARIMKRVIFVGFILFVAGILTLYFMRNGFVRAGVIRGSQSATEQDADLKAANLAVFAGILSLDTLDIDNIKDKANVYTAPKIVTVKDITVKVIPSSLFTDTVHVEDLSITDLEITIEQNGMNNNINDLIQILRKNSPAAGDTTKQSPGKKLKIDTLSLRGTKVHLRASPLPPMDFNLDPITIKDPTNPDGREMKIADVAARVLLQVAEQAARHPSMPPQVKMHMETALALIDKIQGFESMGKKFQERLTNATNPQDLIKTGEDFIKDAQNQGRGIQEIFNRGRGR